MSLCLMNHNAKVGFDISGCRFQPKRKNVPSFRGFAPDTLTRVFALGPTGHCGLRPRTPCRLALKVRFAGRLGGVNLHWYRLTSTLHGDCENFGLGLLYILCVSQKTSAF